MVQLLLKFILIVPIMVAFSGCAYSVATKVEPAGNLYSSHDDKIPGSVVLVIDNDIRNISQSVKASSFVCSAHTFPIDMGNTLTSSIRKTSDALFDIVIEQNNYPTKEQMQALNSKGVIYIKLNRFNPRINFATGFWTATAHASADIVLDITVKDSNNKNLLVSQVSGSRSADGDAGGNCSGGANVLSDAISQTVRDTMERYAERLSNSEKIRTAFAIESVKQETITDKK